MVQLEPRGQRGLTGPQEPPEWAPRAQLASRVRRGSEQQVRQGLPVSARPAPRALERLAPLVLKEPPDRQVRQDSMVLVEGWAPRAPQVPLAVQVPQVTQELREQLAQRVPVIQAPRDLLVPRDSMV